jgi:hypothetical protein
MSFMDGNGSKSLMDRLRSVADVADLRPIRIDQNVAPWLQALQVVRALRPYLAAVRLRNYRYPVRWQVRSQGAVVQLRMIVEVLDRDTGVPRQVTTEMQMAPAAMEPAVLEPEQVLWILHDMLLSFARHEVREAFHVGAMRADDPRTGVDLVALAASRIR